MLRLLTKPKSLHRNTSHKSQKVSKDLGFWDGLLPAVSSLDKNLRRSLKKLGKALYRYKVREQVNCLMA